MAGLGAERAAVDERALTVGDGVLDEPGVGQIPVDAGEIFKAEFVGAVGAVLPTRFLHLSLRLLARSYDTFANCAEPWPRTLGRRFTMPNINPPAGKRATLYRASQLLPRSSPPQA